jgi:hypothetical protein
VPGPLALSGRIATASELAQLLDNLGSSSPDARLLTFRQLFAGLVERFVDALARQLWDGYPLAAVVRP